MVELTNELLKPYFAGRKRHAGFKLTVKKYHELRVHANGIWPEKLIRGRRPNESDAVMKYRHEIYEPVTRDTIQRVMTSLSKIRRTSDWIVKHQNDKFPASITPDERLDAYIDRRYPITGSLENWLFTICLKSYLLDANAAIVVRPIKTDVESNEYLKPFPFIYHSDKVLEFKPDKFAIIELDGDTIETDSDGDYYDKSRRRFMVINTEVFQTWIQTDDGFTMSDEYVHNLGILPVFMTGGQYFETTGNHLIFESRIAPMIPRLNDAAREYSDLQAEVVQHVHSERWAWASEKCGTCQDSNGNPKGWINGNDDKKRIPCPTCKGNLTVGSSPYQTMIVRPTNENLGETAAPIPPAGYIQKQIDIVKIQDERVQQHLFRALSSINFQFLDQTPLNQSGVSKEVDRDELNNFVYSVASDLVRIMMNVIDVSIEYRYKLTVPNDRHQLRPEIIVPEKFDLLSSNYLSDEISRLKQAGVNATIVSALESEYADRKFYGDPKLRDIVVATLEIDPLVGVNDDDKMIRLSTGGVSKLDYLISSNINEFVKQAFENDETFVTRPRSEKIRIIREMAQSKLNEMNQFQIPINQPVVDTVATNDE